MTKDKRRQIQIANILIISKRYVGRLKQGKETRITELVNGKEEDNTNLIALSSIHSDQSYWCKLELFSKINDITVKPFNPTMVLKNPGQLVINRLQLRVRHGRRLFKIY